jgi:hypothetical protein
MRTHAPKKLTGWLIFLIIVLGFGSMGGVGMVRSLAASYEPYFEDYPSLPTAVRICEFLYMSKLFRSVPLFDSLEVSLLPAGGAQSPTG